MRPKRYHSINEALRERFGCKVFKVSLYSGCTCPNRDGTIDTAGCAFCGEQSYEVATSLGGKIQKNKPIPAALQEGIEYVKKRHGAAKFISYFQSGSNTHGPADKLEQIFSAAIDHPDVVGLAIATRPDCVTKAHLDMLERLSCRTMLWVEMGLQSAHDRTLKLINRGHNVEQFTLAAKELKNRNIPLCAHIILGLPGETPEDMFKTAAYLNRLAVKGVKIHNLHILKGTLLEKWYEEGKVEVPDLCTYAQWAAGFIERLNPSILIHRVNGHAPRHLTVAPKWSINKLAIFNAVEKELILRDSWQGKKFPTASPKS